MSLLLSLSSSSTLLLTTAQFNCQHTSDMHQNIRCVTEITEKASLLFLYTWLLRISLPKNLGGSRAKVGVLFHSSDAITEKGIKRRRFYILKPNILSSDVEPNVRTRKAWEKNRKVIVAVFSSIINGESQGRNVRWSNTLWAD